MRLEDYIGLVQKEGINPNYFPKVLEEWEHFLEGEEVSSQIVPTEVIESWQRSRNNGIDPYSTNTHPVAPSTKEYNNLQQIFKRYKFFFDRAIEFIGRKDFTFAFNTADGLTYPIFEGTRNQYSGLIGECSERTVGTTPASLAERYNKSILLPHPYCYCKEYLEMHGAAAPIHNELNEVVGTLCLSFENPQLSLQMYSMINFIAKVFDSLYVPLKISHEKHIQQIINCLPQGVAFVDDRDTVQLYNDKILELVNINRKHNVESELKRRLPKLGYGAGLKNKSTISVTCAEIKMENESSHKLILLYDREGDIKKPSNASSQEQEGDGLFTFDHIIGESLLVKEAKKLAANVSKTSVPVMIHGESGTGKEMFAQAIHSASPRGGGPFVAINCGALPGELVESELFGYVEGSFTGALKGGKIGKVEAASGGTLFLDEIESMPLKDQIKLLRVLSTGKVQKIGSNSETLVDVRIVAATKIDLLKHADEGLFREDLFYRISTFIIELPALRNRKEDIVPLAEYFVKKLENKYNLDKVKMDTLFIDAMQSYSWRGNVRELEHAIERAVIMLEDGKTLMLEHLSPGIRQAYKEKTVEKLVTEAVEMSSNRQSLLDLAEKKVIEYVLDLVDGNQSIAAQQLGINRRTLYTKLHGKSNSSKLLKA